MAMVVRPKAGAGVGVHAGNKHVVAPDAEAEEADEQRGDDHNSVGGDRAAGEIGEQRRGESHAGEDGDVDLGMAEEPEEMQPEHGEPEPSRWRDAVDDFAGGRKKLVPKMAIGEEHGRGDCERAEGDDGEARTDEPGPDGQRKAGQCHALGAEEEDGREEIEGGADGSDAEEADAEEPEIHAGALAGPGGGDGAAAADSWSSRR